MEENISIDATILIYDLSYFFEIRNTNFSLGLPSGEAKASHRMELLDYATNWIPKKAFVQNLSEISRKGKRYQ